MQNAVHPIEYIDQLLTNPALHVACLAIILTACVLAVFSRVYDDTLTQRAAFFIVALGASAQIAASFHGYHNIPAANGAMLVGWAIYCAATIVKIWQRWRASGRPNHPLRRSTDRMGLDPLANTTTTPPPVSTAWQDTIPDGRNQRRAVS